MTDSPNKLFPAWRWVLLATAAGALAGVGAVYVGATGAGNTAGAPAAPVAAASDADRACEAKTEQAAAVGAQAKGHVAAMLAADPPRSLAFLAFNDGDGAPTTLVAMAGKLTLVNLWATWCAPCRAEMPALDTLQKEAGSERFEVVAVNVDTGGNEKPDAFLDEIGVHALARYRDPSLKFFNDLKERGLAFGLPATFLVDAEGCLLAAMNGPAEWSSPDARKLIDTALAQP